MQAVINHLARTEEQSIKELCDYIRFPSVSAQPHHQKDMLACADWLLEHARSCGVQAEIHLTAGHPIVMGRTFKKRDHSKKHFLVYGHYDVQPAEPLNLWKTPPFEPRREGASLFARGASDNKGQNFAHLKAVQSYLATGTDLPCDLTFVIEGEEEVGSNHLAAFLKEQRESLDCDAVVISDTGMPSKKHPALVYALRGIIAVEVKVHGPSRDLHSGIFGGTVDNPAMILCQMLGQLRDSKGRITVPGFYDDVAPISRLEKKHFDRIPLEENAYRKFLGVPALFGEKGFSFVEQRSARPTCEINGLTSGYQGEGSKTIIPSWASAKLTFRLVPNQKPAKILRAVIQHIKSLAPPTVRVEVQPGHGGEPYLVDPSSAHAEAALRTLKQSFDAEPILMREGGSIPIVNDFKKILRADTLLLGLALPDDNAHSPNEKFDLDCFARGKKMAAILWQELASVKGRK
jgi:acetylornithine deacetylase/succinyl-diaminopimelate desuccinylase-like protein